MVNKVNELERAKLAHKHGLDIQYATQGDYKEGAWTIVACLPSWDEDLFYRPHPDDSAKLDEIIWDGADSGHDHAYLGKLGEIGTFDGDLMYSPHPLIAIRELPNNNVVGDWFGIIPDEDENLISDLGSFIVELDDYLNINNLTSVGHGSKLHQAAKDLRERIQEAK